MVVLLKLSLLPISLTEMLSGDVLETLLEIDRKSPLEQSFVQLFTVRNLQSEAGLGKGE